MLMSAHLLLYLSIAFRASGTSDTDEIGKDVGNDIKGAAKVSYIPLSSLFLISMLIFFFQLCASSFQDSFSTKVFNLYLIRWGGYRSSARMYF